MDVQRSLLTAAVRAGDIASVSEAHITHRDIDDPGVARAFEFVLKHWRDHGEVPDESLVDMDFPGVMVEATKVTEPLSYYIEEMRQELDRGALYDSIVAAAEILDDPDAVASRTNLDHIATVLSRAARDYHQTSGKLSVVDLVADGPAFFDKMIEQSRSHRQITGIPTGLEAIDLSTQGMHSEQLWTVVGLPKSGKSLVLLRGAMSAFNWGYRPLFLSFEMNADEQAERYHAMDARVSLTRMQQRRLTANERDRLRRTTERREVFMNDFHVAVDRDSVTTIGGVEARIEQYEPDAVYIDGMYMMVDEEGEPSGSPQAITNITRGLKKLAQRTSLPVWISTQALAWKTTRSRGVEANSTGYSSSFLQDSDSFMTINTHPEDPSVKTYNLELTRKGTPTRVSYKWDFNRTGDLEEVYLDSYDGELVDLEREYEGF